LAFQVKDRTIDAVRTRNDAGRRFMEIHSVAQNSNVIFMDWTMSMVFKKSPSTPMYGSTKLTLHPDGRIIEQRDYYDLWGDIFNGIPRFKGPYRKVMRKYFG
jgi:hypothetical protein